MITIDQLVERIKARQTKGQGTANAIIGAINSNPIAIIIPSHRVQVPINQADDQLAKNHLEQVLREFERS